MTRMPSSGRRSGSPASGTGVCGARLACVDGRLAAHRCREPCRPVAAACRVKPLHRAGGEAGFIADRDRHDRPARPLLFIRDEIGNLGHRHDRDLAAQPFRKPFLRGALLQPRQNPGLDHFDMPQPVDAEEQRGVVAQVEQSQHLAERAPLRRRYRGDAEPALLRLVDADRKGRPEPVDADPAHDVAAQERLEHDVFGHRDAWTRRC